MVRDSCVTAVKAAKLTIKRLTEEENAAASKVNVQRWHRTQSMIRMTTDFNRLKSTRESTFALPNIMTKYKGIGRRR